VSDRLSAPRDPNKHALANVAVRIFSRNNPSFLQVTGGDKNPPSTLYPKIYEADQGRVGSCLNRYVRPLHGRHSVKRRCHPREVHQSDDRKSRLRRVRAARATPDGAVVGTKQLNIKR